MVPCWQQVLQLLFDALAESVSKSLVKEQEELLDADHPVEVEFEKLVELIPFSVGAHRLMEVLEYSKLILVAVFEYRLFVNRLDLLFRQLCFRWILVFTDCLSFIALFFSFVLRITLFDGVFVVFILVLALLTFFEFATFLVSFVIALVSIRITVLKLGALVDHV